MKQGARRRLVQAIAATGVAALGLTGCTPGADTAPDETAEQSQPGEISTDVAAMGDITLTVWDQEVRGGQNAQIEQLNAAFEDAYPNVTINRVSQSFDDLATTLRLAISSDDAPDVVQANNARSAMGSFVAADQIISLDAYADAYAWHDRFDQSVLSHSSYSPDGAEYGAGSLYGLAQMGEIVGVFYSKAKLSELGLEVPAGIDEFEQALQTASDAGETPLLLGNVEKWPAIHVFGPIQGTTTDVAEIQQLGFGRAGASWSTPENLAAAQRLADWSAAGYFNDGANGTDYDAAWQDLARGNGVFLLGGSWLAADLEDAMGDDAGFFTLADASTGGTSIPFTVTSASAHPDAAAAYIDFITSLDAMQIIADNGGLPSVGSAELAPDSGVQADVFAAFDRVSNAGGLLPFLDHATPTFSETLGDALQELIDGRITPEEFIDALETDYADFAG